MDMIEIIGQKAEDLVEIIRQTNLNFKKAPVDNS